MKGEGREREDVIPVKIKRGIMRERRGRERKKGEGSHLKILEETLFVVALRRDWRDRKEGRKTTVNKRKLIEKGRGRRGKRRIKVTCKLRKTRTRRRGRGNLLKI